MHSNSCPTDVLPRQLELGLLGGAAIAARPAIAFRYRYDQATQLSIHGLTACYPGMPSLSLGWNQAISISLADAPVHVLGSVLNAPMRWTIGGEPQEPTTLAVLIADMFGCRLGAFAACHMNGTAKLVRAFQLAALPTILAASCIKRDLSHVMAALCGPYVDVFACLARAGIFPEFASDLNWSNLPAARTYLNGCPPACKPLAALALQFGRGRMPSSTLQRRLGQLPPTVVAAYVIAALQVSPSSRRDAFDYWVATYLRQYLKGCTRKSDRGVRVLLSGGAMLLLLLAERRAVLHGAKRSKTVRFDIAEGLSLYTGLLGGRACEALVGDSADPITQSLCKWIDATVRELVDRAADDELCDVSVAAGLIVEADEVLGHTAVFQLPPHAFEELSWSVLADEDALAISWFNADETCQYSWSPAPWPRPAGVRAALAMYGLSVEELTTSVQLQEEGEEQGNCVGRSDYGVRAARGFARIFRVTSPWPQGLRATIEFSNDTDGTWMLSELQGGPMNANLLQDAGARVEFVNSGQWPALQKFINWFLAALAASQH
ncbi:hypothetical protein ABT392_07945 [Paucibacter sp. JuS9]|uniref:hypothetical protein n=1 Tax=Paucibacter sp. JuS9 TaxID=3228748 RepID=UPI003757185B